MFAIFQDKSILNNLHGCPELKHLGPGIIVKYLILFVYHVYGRRNLKVY
jgi:hypothetical protein